MGLNRTAGLVVAAALGGALWLYPGNGGTGFRPRRQIGNGWKVFTYIG